MEDLERSFGRKADTDRRTTYLKYLDDLDDAKFRRAIDWLVQNSDKFPTIAEIRRAAGEGEVSPTANASAYGEVPEEKVRFAPFMFLPDYDFCPINCQPCDGTMNGKVKKGLCPYDRWKIRDSVNWFLSRGKTIPETVARVAEREGWSLVADIPD
jgi:cytochrome c556